ncbi:MAG: hypothetical protein NVS2B7_00030 [Herpetosiphon sp.]
MHAMIRGRSFVPRHLKTTQHRARTVALALIIFFSWLPIAPAQAIHILATCDGQEIPNAVTADMTLSGRLKLTRSVSITNNATLTLLPGTTVTVCDGGSLFVGSQFSNGTPGGLHAVGTPAQPITFSPVDPTAVWGGVVFWSYLLPSVLQYATLNNAGGTSVTTYDGALTISRSYVDTPGPIIDHVTIANSGNNGVYAYSSETNPNPGSLSNLTITNSAGAALRMTASVLGAIGTGNTVTGNHPNTFQVIGAGTGNVRFSQTWRKQPVPIEILNAFDISGLSHPVVTIEAGNTVLMPADGTLHVGTQFGPETGGLNAVGTADQPITFTTVQDQPWGSLVFDSYIEPVSRLSFVHFSRGGHINQGDYSGTIEVNGGDLRFDHLDIQTSRTSGILVNNTSLTLEDSTVLGNRDGLKFLLRGTGVLRRNTIVGNARYGVINTSTVTCVDARGNFWGNAAGPTDTVAERDTCNLTTTNAGGGSTVQGGVLYEPWLTGLTSAGNGQSSIAPDRLWALGNGTETVTLQVSVRDDRGVPQAGKQVMLQTTRGTLTQPTAPTDSSGTTTATILSNEVGLAQITARNVTDNMPLSALATVTFWRGDGNGGGLVTLTGAPYETPNLIVEGRPFQRSHPVTFRFPVRNSNTTPVGVRITYAISGLNIGGRWTPVFTATRTLAPGEGWDAPGGWLPDVTGHHCIQVTVETAAPSTAVAPAILGNYVVNYIRQKNINLATTYAGSIFGTNRPVNANRLDDALPRVRDLTTNPIDAFKTIVKSYLMQAALVRDSSRTLDRSLSTDPPVHEYNSIATVVVPTVPPIPASGGVTQAQADALNAQNDSIARLRGLTEAIRMTTDRLAGATEANDLAAAARQQAALRGFLRRIVQALRDRTAAIDALLRATEGASVPDTQYGPSELRATADHLRIDGFSADQVNYFLSFGLSASDIEALRQDLLAQLDRGGFQPTSFYTAFHNASTATNTLANNIVAIYGLDDTASVQETIPKSLPAPELKTTFTVGNPSTVTDTVKLVIRPVSLPLNWTYQLDQPTPRLGPGQTTEVTLTLYPNGSVVEQTQVRVAVEGYINDQFIGGIDVRRVAPQYKATPSVEIYLPFSKR